MAPFLVPVAASIAGAAVTGMMNKGGMAKMPTVKAPSTADQDTTPGMSAAAKLGNAASQNQLSSSQTVSNKLLGG